MKALALILALALAVILGVKAAVVFPGQVIVVTENQWTLETSLLLWLLIVVGTYLAVHGTAWLATFPARKARQFSQRRAQAQLELGLLALAEGDFRKAEKALRLSSKGSNAPAASLLAAAQAAQAGGEAERSEAYLSAAEERSDGHRSVPITRAQIALAKDDHETAIALLTDIPRYRTRPRVLELLAEAYRRAGRQSDLAELVPDMIKTGVLTAEEGEALQRNAHLGALAQASDAERLESSWSALSKAARQDPDHVAAYARRALELGREQSARDALKSALDRHFVEELVVLLAQTDATEPAAEMKAAQGWLKKHPESPGLRWYLGRLCHACQLWGKAREHLDAAAQAGLVGARRDLGQLHEELGETAQALAAYREASKAV